MRWEARRCEQGSEQALFLGRLDELVRLRTLHKYAVCARLIWKATTTRNEVNCVACSCTYLLTYPCIGAQA